MATTEQSPQSAGTSNARVRPTTPLDQRSIGDLFATLSRDLSLLVHQEIELAKVGLLRSLAKVGAGAGALAVAGVALLLSMPLFAIAIAFGFHALGLTLGWSFLVVAGAFVLFAMIVAGVGVLLLRKVKTAKQAVDSVKADLHAIVRKPQPHDVS